MHGEASASDATSRRENYNLESTPTHEPRTPLSKTLWGIDWASELPISLVRGADATVHFGSFERALPFVRQHYATIFDQRADSPFSLGNFTDAKARYYREVGDFFEFRVGGRAVALLVGTPVDWSSYYLRSAAALPEFQGQKLIQRFFPRLFDTLQRAGVERVEADTSPANLAVIHSLSRLRFNVTGTVLSERFGACVHLTKFLDRPSEHTFLRQFCAGVMYQLRESGSHGHDAE